MPPRDPVDENEIPEEDEIEGLDLPETEDDGQGEDDAAEDEGRADEDDGQEGQGEEDGRRRVLTARRATPLQKISRQAQEAQARADRLEREIADLRAEQQRSRQPQGESVEQEAARLALMDPEQRSEYRLNKALDQNNRQTAALHRQLADQTDKATFVSLCSDNPLYKRFASQVETKLAEVRRNGGNVDREALVKYLIGEAVASRSPKAIKSARDAGKKNVQRQLGRGTSGRSDQQAGGRQPKDKYAHLEDVTF